VRYGLTIVPLQAERIPPWSSLLRSLGDPRLSVQRLLPLPYCQMINIFSGREPMKSPKILPGSLPHTLSLKSTISFPCLQGSSARKFLGVPWRSQYFLSGLCCEWDRSVNTSYGLVSWYRWNSIPRLSGILLLRHRRFRSYKTGWLSQRPRVLFSPPQPLPSPSRLPSRSDLRLEPVLKSGHFADPPRLSTLKQGKKHSASSSALVELFSPL